MSQKSPQEVFNRIVAAFRANTEVDLDRALADVDTLDAKDQREIADAVEKELIETMPSLEDIKTMNVASDFRSNIKMFNKVATIKGNEAADISRDISADFTALDDVNKNDMLSLMRIAIRAVEKYHLNNIPKR